VSTWLWVRADARRRASSLLLLALLVGIAGAVTIAGVAGARRTTTSWDRLREAEGASNLFFFGQLDGGPIAPEELEALRSIPGGTVAGATVIPLSPGLMGLERSGDMGLLIAADDRSLELATRSQHLRGRLPDPRRPHEVIVNEAVAEQLDLRLGEELDLRTVPFQALDACLASPDCSTEELPPIEVVVSGINRQSDDLDRDAFNRYLVYGGPGLERALDDAHIRVAFVGDVFLDQGVTGEMWTEELRRRLPRRFGTELPDPGAASVHGALRVEAQALLVLAAIAALAGLAAAAQGFSRHLAAASGDLRTLHALGITRRGRARALAASGAPVALLGTFLAIVGALSLSPMFPMGGLGRRAEPDAGLHVDGPVLAVGALLMLATLAMVIGLVAWRRASPPRTSDDLPRSLRLIGGVPLPVGLGAGLTFRGSRGAGLAGGALVGLVVALSLGVGAAVLTASNHDLQSDERLYGQPWEASTGVNPDPEVEKAFIDDLSARRELGAVGVARSGEVLLQLEPGEPRPVFAVGFRRARGDLPLVVLEGREPTAADELAAGSDLLDELGLGLGAEVITAAGDPLRIVGRVVVPIVGGDFPDEAVLLTLDGFEAHASREVTGEPIESLAVFRASEGQDIDELLSGELGDAALLFGSLARKPSDVSNLQGIGRVPIAVAGLTAVLAGLVLAHALLVAERRGRRELATLRALGMRRGDLGLVLLSAGATLALVGLLIGVPLGAVVGRNLWQVIASSVLFDARPVLPIIVVGAALTTTLLVTAAATLVPTIRARQVRPATVLREQ
jgi:hypothetical protein